MKSPTCILSLVTTLLALSKLSSQAFGETLPSGSMKSWRFSSGGSCASLDLSDVDENGEGTMTICTFDIGGMEDGCTIFSANENVVKGTGDGSNWYGIGDDSNCGYINMVGSKFSITKDVNCVGFTSDPDGFSASEGGICTSGAFETFITMGTVGLLSVLFLSIVRAGLVSQ